jgi:hypothetical protein
MKRCLLQVEVAVVLRFEFMGVRCVEVDAASVPLARYADIVRGYGFFCP